MSRGRRMAALLMGIPPAGGLLLLSWQEQTEACLGLACASKPSYSYKQSITVFCYWLLDASPLCQPNCISVPEEPPGLLYTTILI